MQHLPTSGSYCIHGGLAESPSAGKQASTAVLGAAEVKASRPGRAEFTVEERRRNRNAAAGKEGGMACQQEQVCQGGPSWPCQRYTVISWYGRGGGQCGVSQGPW